MNQRNPLCVCWACVHIFTFTVFTFCIYHYEFVKKSFGILSRLTDFFGSVQLIWKRFSICIKCSSTIFHTTSFSHEIWQNFYEPNFRAKKTPKSQLFLPAIKQHKCININYPNHKCWSRRSRQNSPLYILLHRQHTKLSDGLGKAKYFQCFIALKILMPFRWICNCATIADLGWSLHNSIALYM